LERPQRRANHPAGFSNPKELTSKKKKI